MKPIVRAWTAADRLRRRFDKNRVPIVEHRAEILRRIVPGKSFVEFGGMLIDGEISFLAEELGATSVTLVDEMEPSAKFQDELSRRNSTVRFQRGDLHDPRLIRDLGPHDVVWCTGVIYHSPNPYEQLEHLRALTREWMYLGSHVIPEIPGFRNACIWYPGLDEDDMAAYASLHDHPETCWGIGQPFDTTPGNGYANFWWGITPSALRAMVEYARFDVVEEHVPWDPPQLIDMLLRPRDVPRYLPGLAGASPAER